MKINVEKGKYYVYTLARSDGRVFYVGKGIGKRAYQHLYEAQSRCNCKKCGVIRDVWVAGEEVKISIVFRTDSNRGALDYERKLIYDLRVSLTLTNVAHNSSGSERRALQKLPTRWKSPLCPPKPIYDMTADEYKAFVLSLPITDEAKAERMNDWSYRQIHDLKEEWRIARSQRRFDDAASIFTQIEHIRDIFNRKRPVYYSK